MVTVTVTVTVMDGEVRAVQVGSVAQRSAAGRVLLAAGSGCWLLA